MTDYDAAIEQLRSPATWCAGARALARIGDQRALLPLMRAYETPSETSKVCLLDAMDALGATAAAHDLFARGAAEERRIALHLMKLFPDAGHLPLLERAVADADPTIRDWARRALAAQIQNPAWEQVMIQLLAAGDKDTRALAIRALARRRSDHARQALRDRLDCEPSPELQRLIAQMLANAP